MLLFTEAELLVIGECIAKNDEVALVPEMRELYTNDSIEERYAEFGGIIRVVLPSDPEVPKEFLAKKKKAIDNTDYSKLLRSFDLESLPKLSHSLVCYHVDKDGDNAFTTERVEFINDEVILTLTMKEGAATLESSIDFMRRVDNKKIGSFFGAAGKVYEDVIFKHLTLNAVNWKSRQNSTGEIKPLTLKPMKPSDMEPKYAVMALDTLYRPSRSNYEFCDMLYKTKQQKLVCIQVSLENPPSRKVGSNTLDIFLKGVGLQLSDLDKIEFVYVPHPSLASKATVSCPEAGGKLSWCVWEVPEDYGAGDTQQKKKNGKRATRKSQ